MPSLFARRRGSSATRRPVPPSTSSAALAAANAVASQQSPSSNAALSSAAAAAALRSATSSPEPIGNIQTKRMIRRGSQTSIGSGNVMGGRPSPALQRQGSGGSMTERTFRSPSPGRTNSIRSGTASPTPNAPPVPVIPKAMSDSANQRSASLDQQQRLVSPTRNGNGNGRASSLERSNVPPPISTRKGNQLTNVSEELERTDSRSGVNFSRPRVSSISSATSPPTSPVADKQYVHGTGAWFSEPVPQPSSSKAEPKVDAAAAKMARIQAAQSQGTRSTTTTTNNARSSAQGSHLPGATKPTVYGTAVVPPTAPSGPPQAMETVMVYDANSRTFVPKLRPVTKANEPSSPTLPQPPAPQPGTYDPNTRTIVGGAGPSAPAAAKPERPVLNTDLEPPPRNPARLSPTSSPRSSQLVPKQPLAVREEPEEFGGSGVGTAVGGFAQTPSNGSHQRSSSLDVPSRGTASMRGRNSPSPSRSHARFSSTPVVTGTIHDPPPRDLSPAKSALKHSPSSSIRTASPLANYGAPKSPVSETSDNMSDLASQDGMAGKKKKSARVSFDEHANEAVPSPKVMARDRPQFVDDLDDEDFSKPRPALPSFGSVRRDRVVAEKVTEMAPERHEHSNDHAVGGILRNANGAARSPHEPLPPNVTSKEPAGYASDSDDIVEDKKVAPAEPAVPVPSGAETSKDSAPAVEPVVRDFAPATEMTHTDLMGVPEINLSPPTPGTEEVKNFEDAGKPANPSRQSAEVIVPGGWGNDSEAEVQSAGATSATVATIEQPASEPGIAPVLTHSPEEKSPILAPIDEDSDNSAEFSDAAEDLSELETGFGSLNAIAVSPIGTTKPSPSNPPNDSLVASSDGPTVQRVAKNAEGTIPGETNADEDWTAATTYWSKLSRAQREQIEREHLSSDDERPPVATRKLKKAPVKPATNGLTAPLSQKSSQRPTSTQAAQPIMKKTMRSQPDPVPTDSSVHMRRSMRDGGSGGLTSSLRDRKQTQTPEPPRGALMKKSMRPTSSGALSTSSAGSVMAPVQESPYPRIQSRPQSTQSVKPAPPVVSARLQKEMANDSDSESSFKRARRSNASTAESQGRYSMARSMRGAPAPTPAANPRETRPTSPEPPRGKGRDSFSIRSLSPTGSFFGRKKKIDVRESIRGSSVDAPRMTLRDSQPARRAAQPAPPAPAQKQSFFKSKFADSDSDSDGPPRNNRFRSRFADSDDEDDVPAPAALTPVRGIPRRKGQEDGDSTDLDDSENEGTRKALTKREKMAVPMVPDPAEVEKAIEAARKKLGIANEPKQPETDPKQGQALSQGSLRKQPDQQEEIPSTPKKEKRGFMGSILRRNRSSQQSIPHVANKDMPPMPASPAVATPQQHPTAAPSSPAVEAPRPMSPTSPGKLVRRSSNQPQPQMKRFDSNYSTATAPPMVGESTYDSNWPLPPVPSIPDQHKSDERPNTSDGMPGGGIQRSQSGGVRFSEQIDGAQGPGTIYSSRTGKKKKFGMLRRAFGLND